MKKLFAAFSIMLIASTLLHAQTADSTKAEPAEKPKISLFDEQDGYFDLSDFVINYHGFIPVPIIITEPAIGGFGGAVAPVFIAPKKLGREYYAQHPGEAPIPPDITALFGGYTVNNTWMVGGGRMGTWVKPRIRYVVAGGYGTVNMSFYKQLEDQLAIRIFGSELEADMSMKAAVAFGKITHQLKGTNLFAGVQYLFMNTKAGLQNNMDSIPPLLSNLADKEVTSNISQLGAVVEYDDRDNTFTPNRGLRIHTQANFSEDFLGSDFNYQIIDAYVAYYYSFVSPAITLGARGEVQQAWNDIPFYRKPYVDMRGIPTARYQGMGVLQAELEGRWDVAKRWSAMLFAGGGKGFDSYNKFSEADWAYAGGTGFRYLIARKLNLRMGVDLAFGSDGTIAYYIVFGSTWNR